MLLAGRKIVITGIGARPGRVFALAAVRTDTALLPLTGLMAVTGAQIDINAGESMPL